MSGVRKTEVNVGTSSWVKVDPCAAGRHVPMGWIAYRSSKTVAEMLAETRDEIARNEGITEEEAYAEMLRRAIDALSLKIAEADARLNPIQRRS
ncbi:hypothetical protein ACVNIS_07230 [Sphaerotilaceae bacterium SBD11-9]